MSITWAFWLLLTLIIMKESKSATFYQVSCPLDCICYPDYMSNLASWQWIEKNQDIEYVSDSAHEEFNPYTENNEVYENPVSTRFMNEDPLKTVTCILRNGSAESLKKTFSEISGETQVLSLIQAAGSGTILIKEKYFENLRDLIGVQFQGHKSVQQHAPPDLFKIGADALSYLDKLIYLSLEHVKIQERELQNHISDTDYTISTIVKFTRHGNTTHVISKVVGEGEQLVENDIQSQLMFLSPVEDEAGILPYNVYKKKKEAQSLNRMKRPSSLEPTVKVAFTNIPTLLQLRISDCKIAGISWDMFYKLNNLKYLVLERNDLLFLPDFAFYSTPNLTSLSLAGNKILSLQTVGLAGLLQLQKLDVTFNNLTYLSELSLPPFPHLEIADFRLNPIETIFPNTFEVMNTTRTLYLGSPLVPLEFLSNSFVGLVSLQRLQINNVRIEILEKLMLKGMPQLRILVLTGKIPRISFDAFNEVPNIEKLVLKKCSIRKISMDAFTGLTSLRELDLSHNSLTFLPTGLLDDQLRLEEIYLQHNQLVSLPINLFDKSPVRLARLNENPWHCSCEMITWNSTIINHAKRYGLVKNTTVCQRQYDKGSMCLAEHVKLEARYVYEKRVSPVCATPSKFQRRSVFEVVRKELQQCSLPTVRTEPSFLTSFMKTTIHPLTKSSSKYKIVKTQEQIEKEREKQLHFDSKMKPVKIKKPHIFVKNNLTSESIHSLLPNTTSSGNPTRPITYSDRIITKNVTHQPTFPSIELLTEDKNVSEALPTVTSSTVPKTSTNLSNSKVLVSSTSLPPLILKQQTQILPEEVTETPSNLLLTTAESTDIPELDSKLPQTTETRMDKSTSEESSSHYNTVSQFQVILHQYKKNYFQSTTETPSFVSKLKIPVKQPRQLKPAKERHVISKNALKLARIQRKLEKRA